MKDRLMVMAEAVYNNEHTSEDARLSAYKVTLGLKWGGRIAEGTINKVVNTYENLIRTSTIVGV